MGSCRRRAEGGRFGKSGDEPGWRRGWAPAALGGLAAGGLQRVTEGGGAVDAPFVRREKPFARQEEHFVRQEEPSDRREKASAKASASPSIGQAPSAQKAESRWP